MTKVGLVQINNSFSGQNYLPYSAGILQAYAQAHLAKPADFQFLSHIYRRMPVDEAADSLGGADIVGFSAYVWNIRISLKIAETLKRRNPRTLIFFGGPHVPDRVEPFLRANPFIDLACHGEGEQVFLSLLENLDPAARRTLPSISFLDRDGALVQTPRAERLRDLSTIPSPYLSGVFEPLMAAHPEEHWIALWETNRGCPFSCTFCDWGSAVAAKVVSWDVERLHREVEWFSRHRIEFVFCADANFGMLPRDVELAQFCADAKLKTGYPRAVSVQNTKNATERSYMVQKILSDAGLNKGVVVSLQSVDPATLKAIKRDNISLDTYHEIQRRFAAQGVETMSDLILGLPGETYDSFANGVSTVIDNGQHNRIQFNNLSILPNAEMGDPDYQRKYGMVTVENKVVNIHGELVESKDDVYETQQLVVGTASMPRPDWARTRAFCWWAGLLHFDKVLQIPLVTCRHLYGVSYRELIELFSEGRYERLSKEAFPVLAQVRSFFLDKARDIQGGGAEFCHSKRWLNIWWPADEYVLLGLCGDEKLGAFYEEAERVLAALLAAKGVAFDAQALRSAIRLNQALIKRPFQTEDVDVAVDCNVWEVYRGVVSGSPVPLKKEPRRYHVNRTRETWKSWDDWARQVIWWGNKKGAYLYGSVPIEPAGELAGHY